ncbi:MAG: NAD(P)/FAD-dependent oxidoreductase [Alphaproteobacteria bacterium]|nr:NAD(P)/FAD-dependent oxidoreductase [Alphaproteobacteria bacterium]
MRAPPPAAAAFDAAVVGSGPNGLAAAVALAQAGRKVVVYEASETIGGSARTLPLTLPGFRHDVCSAIHPMAKGSPFLSTLPLAEHGLTWIDPPATVAHPLDGQPAVLQYRELDRTAETLGADRDRYAGIVGPFVAGWSALSRDGMAPVGGIPSRPVLMARFGLHAMVPATTLGRTIFRDERTRAWWGGFAAHSCLPLDRSPSAAIGLMLLLAGHGVGWPFPRGGAQAIPDALASLLRSLGGEIRTGVHITDLEQIETDGPVLFQTSPPAVAEICGDALPERYRRRLQAFRWGPGIFKVDWALSQPIPWADPTVGRAGTVHLGGDLDSLARSERAPWQGRVDERPFVLVCQPGAFDERRAPAGRSTAWGYIHVPNGDRQDHTAIVEAAVERSAPGFRDCILARHVMTATDFAVHNDNYVGGDVNGGANDLDQLFTRPVARLDPYSTPNPRLFLCSASTPPGGGVHGMAGWYAAQSALGRPLRPPEAA